MINPDIIKRNTQILYENLKRREIDYDVEKLIELDTKRRNIQVEIDKKRNELNRITEEIEILAREKKDISKYKEEARKIREEIKNLEEQKEQTEEQWKNLILFYPNIVHQSVPDREPKIVKVKGEPFSQDHHKPHWEFAEKIGIDFKAGAKISGSGFTVLSGQAAKLERALINLMIDQHVKRGYTEYFTPYLVREEIMIGTGQLPKFSDDMYSIEKDNLWLIPTAEVPLVNIFRDTIIPEEKLNISIVGYSACFRREAGAWGKETRGLIRQHQFNKVELVKISKPEDSYNELEKLVDDACHILDLLELNYRVILLPANDMGFSASKTYDIEIWMPGYKNYLEISSCSNCEDFQARRTLTRLRRKSGKVELVHTLNGSGVAVGRCLAGIIETHLQKDGSIKIPEALRDYMKADYIYLS
ncbi:MAG: serine--tRNA ligase [Candidatus Calescibacterium sp.]|nr:serine--tRNA ligase [Candidatus Calescibacterium sp.]MCX7734962.1 serine--tRNA ligase [bacterium]MDW8088097.1 serine--tRNA ligase [Candidatus Calescibacterium sp.]